MLVERTRNMERLLNTHIIQEEQEEASSTDIEGHPSTALSPLSDARPLL